MEDKAKRYVLVIQDPEGVDPKTREMPVIPTTVHTVVLEVDYLDALKKLEIAREQIESFRILTENLKLNGPHPSSVGEKPKPFAGPYNLMVCPVCGKVGGMPDTVTLFSKCDGGFTFEKHVPTRYEKIQVVKKE